MGFIGPQELTSMLYSFKDTDDGALRDNDFLHFVGFCMSNLAVTNSQCFQDVWVLYEMLKYSSPNEHPFFVEFGADNGLLDSNTLLLQNLGWHGILSEPNPERVKECKSNRESHHVSVYDYAVWNIKNGVIPFMVSGEPNLSTLPQYAKSDYNAKKRTENTHIIDVETIGLYDLLREDKAPKYIDYISVDTEGSEYEVLHHFFEWYSLDSSNRHEPPYLMTIEHNYQSEQKQKIETLMTNWEYEQRFPDISRWDSFWRKKT